jgi:predicted dehydrogenase
VQIEGYWDMPAGFGFNMGFTARFENAAVVWDLASGKPLTVYPDTGSATTPTPPGGGDGYFGEIDYFLTCIEQNREPTLCPPPDSREAVRVALLEEQSIRTGKTVTVTAG